MITSIILTFILGLRFKYLQFPLFANLNNDKFFVTQICISVIAFLAIFWTDTSEGKTWVKVLLFTLATLFGYFVFYLLGEYYFWSHFHMTIL